MYIPEWMMKTLQCKGGDHIRIQHCQLPKGTFIKIQPQSVNFLDIWDPRGALENALKMFSTLTKDDIFSIKVGENIYEIKVLEVQPEVERSGISVYETDLNVDFAPPVGYVEPERQPVAVKNMEGFVRKLVTDREQKQTTGPFVGQGKTFASSSIQKKNIPDEKTSANNSPVGVKMPEGKLYIPRKTATKSNPTEKSNSPFQGTARTLK